MLTVETKLPIETMTSTPSDHPFRARPTGPQSSAEAHDGMSRGTKQRLQVWRPPRRWRLSHASTTTPGHSVPAKNSSSGPSSDNYCSLLPNSPLGSGILGLGISRWRMPMMPAG